MLLEPGHEALHPAVDVRVERGSEHFGRGGGSVVGQHVAQRLEHVPPQRRLLELAPGLDVFDQAGDPVVEEHAGGGGETGAQSRADDGAAERAADEGADGDADRGIG